MRKVVLYALLSVDGVAEAPETFVTDFDAQMNADLADAISTQDAVLLGRVLYEEWAAYWPTATEQPFADFINRVSKYVATSSPLTGKWSNAAVMQGPPAEFVRGLKSQRGGDIGIHGSLQLSRSLLKAGLVDELHLVITPCLHSDGRRLLRGLGIPSTLKLISSSSTTSGSLIVHYRMTQNRSKAS